MTLPTVSVGISQRSWAGLFKEFVVDHGGVRLVGTVLTQADALEQGSVVLVADDVASFLTPRLVRRLQRIGRRIVGVFDPLEGDAGRKRLIDMNVDAVASAHDDPERILETVVRAAAGADVTGPEDLATPRRYGGRLTVVTGFGGATEVAVHLGARWARRHLATIVADFDTVSPAVAQRLGLEPSPNLLSAVDTLLHARGEADFSLQAHRSGVAVLAGIPRPKDWELAPAEHLSDLVAVLSEQVAHLVVNTGFVAEHGRGPGLRGRFDAARVAAGEADSVVICALPSPVGVRRVAGWVADVRGIVGARLHVVMNHAPRSLYQRGEVVAELVTAFRPASVTWIPTDRRMARHSWDGEVRRRGPFVRAVDSLARRVESDPLRVRSTV